MSWRETELEVCTSLDELLDSTTRMMRKLRDQGYEIHHVAGAISADGDEHIPRNLAELSRQQARVAQQLGERAVVITSPRVFTDKVYASLRVFEMAREEREACLQEFWDKVIGSGLLDGVHLAPGWERSPGTNKEHEAAQRYGVPIEYLDTGD